MAILKDLLLWLTFGSLCAISVFKRAGGTEVLNRHPKARNLFFLGIVLGGPLLFFIAILTPVSTVQRLALAGRKWLDTPRLTWWEKRRIRRAQQKLADAQRALKATPEYRRFDEELRKIGGQRD
jgi:hypothetical protein